MTLEIKKGQPLTLPNGDVVLPPKEDGQGAQLHRAPEIDDEAQEEIADVALDGLLGDPFDNAPQLVKRTLADVDHNVKQQNAVMIILAYEFWGLDDYAIARIINSDPNTIERIRGSDLYVRVRQEMLAAFEYAQASTIHGYLSQKARPAAATMVGMLKSKSADTRMSAAKDILDRTGFRPADRIEHVHKFEDELRIKYVEDVPNTINVTPEL